MVQIVEKKEQCCGCSACFNICPKGAITMEADAEGFLYPQIDESKCIECKLCQKVCPEHKALTEEVFEQRYFAVQHKDKNVVAKSSSGGVFTALSDVILQQNGVVYGVAFGEAFEIEHKRAEDVTTRDSFRTSKYVQSNMKSVMSSIVSDLEEGKTVMFTGSPCQVAGVSSFVMQKRKTLEGLFLCDFICHGAASPAVWKKYVHFLQEKYNGEFVSYNFRGKAKGWHNFFPEILTDKKNVSEENKKQQSFFLLYSTCFINRPSCYQCRYTSYNRQSDITLGDFWNIDKIAPELDDNTGTSQVLVNTEKGMQWFEQCEEVFKHLECSKEDVWQPHLEYPNEIPKKREKFWQEYQSIPFSELLSKYGKGSFVSKCKSFATPIVKKLGLYVLAGKVYKWLFVRKGHEA